MATSKMKFGNIKPLSIEATGPGEVAFGYVQMGQDSWTLNLHPDGSATIHLTVVTGHGTTREERHELSREDWNVGLQRSAHEMVRALGTLARRGVGDEK
jgi:hypothetical protein